MPTYEYRCKDCGRDLEVVQSFTDDPLTTCEACGGPLRKVFGNVGIAFKGSGFYKNDSRGKPSTSTSGDKAGATSSEKPGGDTKGNGKGAGTTSDGASSPATSTKKDAPAPSTAGTSSAS